MTVSISNMTAVWSNTSTNYTGIGLNANGPGTGNLISLKYNGSARFSADSYGNAWVYNTLSANTVSANIVSKSITSNVITSNAVYTKVFSILPHTVAALPSASASGVGSRSFVIDASSNVFASAVAAGGTNAVPVYSGGLDKFFLTNRLSLLYNSRTMGKSLLSFNLLAY